MVAFASLMIMIASEAPLKPAGLGVRSPEAGIRDTNGVAQHGVAFPLKTESGRGKATVTGAEAPRAQVSGADIKAASLQPIPVELKFLNDEFGSGGKVIFTSSSPRILAVIVRVTSQPSGRVREFHFRLSTVMSEAIAGGPDRELLADGDEIELTAPGYLPLRATFHRSTKH